MKLNLRQSDVSASRKGCTYYGLGAGSSLPHWLVVRQVIGLSGKIIPAGIRDFWCMEFLVPGRLYYFTIKSREINPLSRLTVISIKFLLVKLMFIQSLRS